MSANYFSTAAEVAFTAQCALAGFPSGTNPNQVPVLMKRAAVEPKAEWLQQLGDSRLANMHARLSSALARIMHQAHMSEERKWLDASRNFVAAARPSLKLLLQGLASCWSSDSSGNPFDALPIAALSSITTDKDWRPFVRRIKDADFEMMKAIRRGEASSAAAPPGPASDHACPSDGEGTGAQGASAEASTIPERAQQFMASATVPTIERADVRMMFKTIQVPGGGFKENLHANYSTWVEHDLPTKYASLRPKPTQVVKLFSKVGCIHPCLPSIHT